MFDINLLTNTLGIQTTSYNSFYMERYLRKFFRKNNIAYDTDNYGNIYAIKGSPKNGEFYPTMVCHIDTVHDINMDSIVKSQGDLLYSIDKTNCQRTGIGGDDKVGVFITLSLLLHMPVFKAVFFKDEEVGCVGSSSADHTYFDDSSIVLQCDRKGMGDFVSSIYGVQLCNKELLNDIDSLLTQYSRKSVTGGLTDVKSIASANDVQCANVNCGYYDPHTDDEYVSISDVESTLYFCHDVLRSTQSKRYTMKRAPEKKYDISTNDWSYTPYGSTMKSYPVTAQEKTAHTTCPICQSTDTDVDFYNDDHYCFTCDKYFDEMSYAKI